MAIIKLANLADTRRLGKWLAENLEKFALPAVFLRGELGLGKTTLVKFLVDSLPGAENAEVCSPSFNIYNIYPTTPPVMHCDLYRCQGDYPDDVLEALENKKNLVLIEWADYFSMRNLPPEFLDLSFRMEDYTRLLHLDARGQNSSALLSRLVDYWRETSGN